MDKKIEPIVYVLSKIKNMDYASDSDDEDLDPIFEDDDENEFLDNPKENNKYYIGACKLIRPDNYFVLLSAVSNRVFLQYPGSIIRRYLESASIIYANRPTIDIMKLEILPNDTYAVVKKTHWIRLVQRHWRRVLKERMAIRLKRGSIMAQRHFEMHGRYPYGLASLPQLNGMLRTYGLSKDSRYKN